MTVTVTIDDRLLRVKLRKLEEALGLNAMLGVIGADVLAWIGDNFRRRGIERKWKPLAQNTIAARRKGSSAPLQDTGRLKQSFVSEVRGNAVEVGTVNRVAPFHHEGTRPYTIRPRRAQALRFRTTEGAVFARSVRHPGIPARPLIPSKRVALQIAIKSINALMKRKLPK